MTPVPDSIAAARAAGLGPVELTEACLERAQATAALGAWALLDAEGARAQARALAGQAPRGPLHGIPVAVKDVIDVAGLPTRAGSGLTGGEPAERDAPVVARLREAGAVILGKTTTHPLAFGVTTPQAANPVVPSRTAGGSSGGSAVAVATGAALAALGTDTAGSVRLPAAFCGVAGLKARPDALPKAGILPLAPSMDSGGVLARDPAGLALLWDVLGEPAAAGEPLRIGVPDPPPRCDREVAAVVARAVDRLGAAEPVAVPPWEAWPRPRGRVLVAEALAAHRELGWYPGRAAEYGAEARAYLRAAERLSAADVAAAREELAALAAGLRAALDAVDVLALPVAPVPPPARDTDPREASFTLTTLVGPANAAGLAAASVPCGTTGDGLPVGLQLVAADEARVLAAAALTTREVALR